MTGFTKINNPQAIDSIFKEYGLSPEWAAVLDIGLTKLYDNNTKILNYYISDGICIINSGSINNESFPKSMLKDIKTLINEHKSIIISSKVASIGKYLKKLGFRYNTKRTSYYRDIIWE